MTPNDNTLIRSRPCEECGTVMLWTQAAWPDQSDAAGSARAAYRCRNGHTLNPASTPQCPKCGIHDTAANGSTQFRCQRCGHTFSVTTGS